MKKVEIQTEHGDQIKSRDFIAWKDDRRSFYARPYNGKPRVISMTPPLPSNAVWIKYPFPECAPVKIAYCYLLAPPCRESETDWKRLIPEEWEYIYHKTHEQGLHLNREDEKELAKRLDVYKKAARSEYESEKGTAKRIKDPEERSRQFEAIEHEYNAPVEIIYGLENAGKLNMTLGMAKHNFEGIRDAYLIEVWAKDKGINLGEMWHNRANFMQWIKSHAGLPAVIHDMRIKVKRNGCVPVDFHGDDDPRFKTLCAGVRFRVEFENGDIAFLNDCRTRTELRAEELRELKREHGFETPKEKRDRKNRAKGGKQTTKIKDPATKKAIANNYRDRLKSQGPTTAAKGTARWVKERFGVNLTYKTVQNYAKEDDQEGKR